MKYTHKQRRAIISWWSDSYVAFRFMKDGSVEAKKRIPGAWGLLYTPFQARTHLLNIGL